MSITIIDIKIMEFKGTLEMATNYLLKYYCSIYHPSNHNAWMLISHSSLNGIEVVDEEGFKYRFWAGVSGCNWNIIDRTGGNHMCSNIKDKKVTVLVPEEWVLKKEQLLK